MTDSNKEEDQVIEYTYLDVDNEKLYADSTKFHKAMKSRSGSAILRAMPNRNHNQVLIAGGSKTNTFGEKFSEYEAILLCRKLSGLSRVGAQL